MIKKITKFWPLFILCIIYLVFAFSTYKHYGITADEELEYKLGKNMQNFFTDKELYFENDTLQQKPYLKYYYHLYPMVLTFINTSNYYEWHHLLNMLFALPLLVAAYFLLYFETKHTKLALLAPLTILLTPSFLGSIPANSEDVPFATLYFICFTAIYVLLTQKITRKTYYYLFLGLFGIALGVTQSMRIIGYTLYIIYVLGIFIFGSKVEYKQKIKELVVLTTVAHLTMYLTFPYIQQNPINLIELLTISKTFSPWNNSILYLGNIITRHELPGHYLFVYLLTTTPVFILLTTIGSLKYIKVSKLLKYLWTILTLNLLLYVVMKPVIYNGLRHFIFLLPIISIISSLFCYKLIIVNQRFLHLVTIAFIAILASMYRLHPYEYIYFSDFSKYIVFKGHVENYLETDYWGASYKEATAQLLEYLSNTNRKVLPYVYACNVDYAVRYYSQAKFEIAKSREEADYIICDYQNDLYLKNSGKALRTVKRDGMVLNVVRYAPTRP